MHWEHLLVTDDSTLPETFTLDEVFRVAFFLDMYVGLESRPDECLMLFHRHLRSDPVRWEDWKRSVRAALTPDTDTDPLAENLHRELTKHPHLQRPA